MPLASGNGAHGVMRKREKRWTLAPEFSALIRLASLYRWSNPKHALCCRVEAHCIIRANNPQTFRAAHRMAATRARQCALFSTRYAVRPSG